MSRRPDAHTHGERGPVAPTPNHSPERALMTDTPMTPDREQEIREALRVFGEHPSLGFACCSAHDAADAVSELLAEVDRLRDRVAELDKDSLILSALEAAGVDNWEGYDDALRDAP